MDEGQILEEEIKIPVQGFDEIRQRLRAGDWQCTEEALREQNILVDRPDGELRSRGRALRLRQHGERTILTLKGRARYEGAVKIRPELEVELSSLDTMAEILESLGFSPVVRYEKDREIWQKRGLTVTLDHTPIGDFVEIEGLKKNLAPAAVELGLDVRDAVPGSYLGLWELHRLAHPEKQLPRDMVFEE
jgi:adenylate cyclase class 2